MPEGDTVHLVARILDDALAGRRVVRSELRVPQVAAVRFDTTRVLGVVPRGKHLLMRFDDGRTLHSHLRLDGMWHVVPRERRAPAAEHQVRAIIDVGEHVAAGVRVHDLRVVDTTQEDELVGHLGPDLLGPDWDADEALHRLTADPTRWIGPALLDQRSLAGIGTLYRSEALFIRGTSPWTPVGEVRDLPRLVDVARRMLLANRDRWEQVTTGDRRPGRGLWVFQRTGRPCRRCGAPVRAMDQPDHHGAEPQLHARPVYWCAACQPGPKPEG